MKHFYTIFALLLFNISSFAQTDIYGEWFLHVFVDLDVVFTNTYSPQISIVFTENSGIYYGQGVCNDYQGDVVAINSNTFEAMPATWTLAICEYNNSPSNLLESTYKNLFQYNYNSPNATVFDYTITGSGVDAVLQIVNSTYDASSETEIGYIAIYGKQMLSVSEHKINSLKLKENPVSNTLQLLTNQNFDEELLYSIYSIDGKSIVDKNILKSNNILINFLNQGIYFLRLQLENKNKIIKFIKQ